MQWSHPVPIRILTSLTVVTFSPGFSGLKAHSSLVQVYNLVPDSLWQLFGVAVERLTWKKLILWTGVLYTYNELRSGVIIIDWLIVWFCLGCRRSNTYFTQWHTNQFITFFCSVFFFWIFLIDNRCLSIKKKLPKISDCSFLCKWASLLFITAFP